VTASAIDAAFVAYSEGFERVLGDAPRLSLLARVESPAVQSKRLPLDDPDDISLLVAQASGGNGMASGRDGRLIVCEQGSRCEPARISRLDRTSGEREGVVEDWRGLPFNSPNDAVVASDGAIWFTDPSYGHLQGFRPAPVVGDFVYRHDPATGDTTVVADGFDKPNGIALSPDERTLYVTDRGANQEPGGYYRTRPHHIKAFDVTGGTRVNGERLFAVVTPGFADGLKVDRDGRVYASSFSGVQVFDPEGERLGEIHLPGAVNFCFGGPAHDLLLITTDSAVWAAALAAKGA
jgi:gluconolactonase